MASRSLLDLSEAMYRLAESFVTRLDESGIPYLVICTLRSMEEQDALYAQGRQPIETVNKKRRAAGLALVDVRQNLKTVTKAKPGDSRHNPDGTGKANALDIVPLDGGKIVWDADHPLYEQMGAIGEDCGLTWGGRWRMRDMPHFEI